MKIALKKMLTLIATTVMTASMTYNSDAHAQNLGLVECPPGFVQGGANLCIQPVATGEKNQMIHFRDRRPTANKTIVKAQIECRAMGAHVCNMDEIYEAWDVVHPDLGRHEALGNMGMDDHHLCVNNPGDKENFEGICHKHMQLRFRCCMSFSALPGMGGF